MSHHDASPSKPSKPSKNWQALLQMGLADLRAGNQRAALSKLRKAARLAPGDFNTRMAMATALIRQGKAGAALAEFKAASQIDPSRAGAYHGIGLACHALSDRPEALAAFRRAVTADPLAFRSWGSIADITEDEGERVNAVEAVADALMVQLGGEGRDQIDACVRALLDARRPREAVWLLRNRQGRARSLAQALYELGDFPGAFELARQAYLADPPKPARNPLQFSPAVALDALTGIVEILEAAGLRPFLVAGTLLGIRRSGAPLPHDRDVDIGVLRAPDGPDLCAVLRAHPKVSLPRRSRPGDRYVQVWLGGVGIDIFLHDPDQGALLCGLGSIRGDIQWRFTAFEPVTRVLGGRSWPVPDQPDRYLAESYGPDWQTPDPHFASVLSSPALHKVDAHVRGCYAIWRAEKALRANDTGKAAALLAKTLLTCDLTVQGPTIPP